MPDEVKLEPCPFCARDAEIEETGGSQSASFATHYRVNCKVYAHANMAWATDRNEAIAAWNTRPRPTAATDDAVAELRHRLRMIISHASGGALSEPADIDRSVNDICVEISRHKNEIWKHAQEAALAKETADVVKELVRTREALAICQLHNRDMLARKMKERRKARARSRFAKARTGVTLNG